MDEDFKTKILNKAGWSTTPSSRLVRWVELDGYAFSLVTIGPKGTTWETAIWSKSSETNEWEQTQSSMAIGDMEGFTASGGIGVGIGYEVGTAVPGEEIFIAVANNVEVVVTADDGFYTFVTSSDRAASALEFGRIY